MSQEPQEVGPEIMRVFPQVADTSDTWQLLARRGCVTTRDAATALGITRKAAWERLRRLMRRGYVEARLVDGVVWWCLARGAPPAPPRRRPRGPSRATLRRAEAVRGFIERWGCATTAALRRRFGLSEAQVRYVVYSLMSRGIVQKMVGATALWCRDSAAAQAHVERLRDAVKRLIAQNGVRYVTITKVLELIRRDGEARRLFSRYISLERHSRGFPAASLGFVGDILTSLYGEPATYSKHAVYFVPRGASGEALPDHVAKCCALLRAHIEWALSSTRGGVISVKTTHLTKDAELLPRYSWCLSRLLRAYRRGSGYVMPRGEAQELLSRLEQLCASLVKRRKKVGGERRRARGDAIVAFYISKSELAALDKYAEEVGASRSDVVRLAIERLLEKLRAGGYDNRVRA